MTITVDCENLDDNPKCAHGPTLKFTREVKGKAQNFYACSACRDRKDCPFFLLVGDKITESKQLSWDHWRKKSIPQITHHEAFARFNSFEKLSIKLRKFCFSCFQFVFPAEVNNHDKHDVKANVSDLELRHPTLLICPLQKSKKEAQFWFTPETLNFIISNVSKMKFSSVLCIGTPTVHEVLRDRQIKSLLLDIDHRYHSFYSSSEFCWFNMFNFYFMGNESFSRSSLEAMLNSPPTVVIVDPPFGARIEPLVKTIEKLQKQATENLKIILILPYFMEPHVLSHMENFKMLDFPIEYTNHKKFINKSDSPKPSPVRLFTNVEPHLFEFPQNGGYIFCDKCKAWRSKNNKHCSICNVCPSKNGSIYVHCNICKMCVKSSWKHCKNCHKCMKIGHECTSKSCHKCMKIGHECTSKSCDSSKPYLNKYKKIRKK